VGSIALDCRVHLCSRTLMFAVGVRAEVLSSIAPLAAVRGGSAIIEAKEEEHRLSPKAVELIRVFGFPIPIR